MTKNRNNAPQENSVQKKESPLADATKLRNIQPQYKDAVFRSYFKDKKRILSLYRAVSGDSSPTEDSIELVDLEGVFENGKRNDVSFIYGDKLLVLIEHQSTLNENMPVRFLMYLGNFYHKLIKSDPLYKGKLIKLPEPYFYVFYNGKSKTEPVKEMRLSDAFYNKNDNIELVATAYDIRYETNSQLLQECREVMEYSIFVRMVDEFKKDDITTELAIRKAVKYCIENDVMKEFLEKHKDEVITVFTEEWDAEKAKRIAAEEAAEEARKEERDKVNTLNKILIAAKRFVDLEKAANDSEYQNKLMMDLLPAQ